MDYLDILINELYNLTVQGSSRDILEEFNELDNRDEETGLVYMYGKRYVYDPVKEIILSLYATSIPRIMKWNTHGKELRLRLRINKKDCYFIKSVINKVFKENGKFCYNKIEKNWNKELKRIEKRNWMFE